MRTTIVAILGSSLALIATQPTHAQIPSDLRHFIQSEATKSWDDVRNAGLRYQAAKIYLHAGEEQYIVYWSGPGACGSGGCNMDIIERRGKTFRIIASTTITRLPIRVLDSQTNGWRDIGVFVAGGGILPGYEARLRFNGKKYPSNPSMQPSTHHAVGKTVLSESTPTVLLFPAAR